MNEYVLILRSFLEQPQATQRDLVESTGMSLGKINKLVSECVGLGYLNRDDSSEGRGRNVIFSVTEKGLRFLQPFKVDAALILASGFGSRCVPLTYETPKGLLEVYGERMIERQIRQLHEAGVQNITIVVGYLKEKFDYLVDKWGVSLLYNPEYTNHNTIATIRNSADFLRGKNCYILSSDNWMRYNLYHAYEPAAWYAASYMKGKTKEWALNFSRNGAIQSVHVGGEDCWCMYGPVYFSKEFTEKFLPLVDSYYHMPGTEEYYWEDVYLRNIRSLPALYINKQPEYEIYEFENLEELRQFDDKYIQHSGSAAMELVSSVFHVPESDITGIRCLKAGMTNKSWLFHIQNHSENKDAAGKSYICRIPGPGTSKLISRAQEKAGYEAVRKLNITDELIYFNAENGYKISRYYENSRNSDFHILNDRKMCMGILKGLHNAGITVPYEFNLQERFRCYEKLATENGGEIPFEDYPEMRLKAQNMLDWVDSLNRPKTLCHIDPVYANFILTEEGFKLIDWEYNGMADPLLDIAMSANYAYMTFPEADDLLEIYRTTDYCPFPLEDNPDRLPYTEGGLGLTGIRPEVARELLHVYIGLAGLLWALWCVYKMHNGQVFDEYSLKMYRYFKDADREFRNFAG